MPGSHHNTGVAALVVMAPLARPGRRAAARPSRPDAARPGPLQHRPTVHHISGDHDAGYEWLATLDEDWRRALDVQATLWRSGRTRAVGFPDLLIAAVAEREHLTVLHYDSDSDHIAAITGQPTQWVTPRGTIP